MVKMAERSRDWTDADPLNDFASTLWLNLEQQGDSVYVAPTVTIAQDLTDPQQMVGARND